MKLIYLIISVFLLTSCQEIEIRTIVSSPDGKIQFKIQQDNFSYQVFYNKEQTIESSRLGLIRRDAGFNESMTLKSASEPVTVKSEYELFTGKKSVVKYNANRVVFSFENKEGKDLNIEVQVSNDGVAFRYVFPEEVDAKRYLEQELTEFVFNADTKAWLQPMSVAKSGWKRCNPAYEEHYQMEVAPGTPSKTGQGWVYPALFKTSSAWVLISEAGVDRKNCATRLMPGKMDSTIYQVGYPQEAEFIFNGPLKPEYEGAWTSPWRVLAIGDLKTIMESTLGTDVAPVNKVVNKDFIKPGIASWSWIVKKDNSVNYDETIKYIDMASSVGWSYCLIDADWDTKIGYEKMQELIDYAQSKGVGVLLWYNSAGDWNETPYHPRDVLLTHESREAEFQKLKEMGVAGLKIDFFGGDGQSVMDYYLDILEDAAKYELLINFHGATLPRGWHKTYPHLMTVEAVLGMEFVTFTQQGADAQPSHCAMLPFARNLFDPMDFTPMNLSGLPGIDRRTTPGFELALPIVFTSGIQHLAETPEGMEEVPEFASTFLKELPVRWDETRFIDGYPGKYVVLARRSGEQWFVAGINGTKEALSLKIDLSDVYVGEWNMIYDLEPGNMAKKGLNVGEEELLLDLLPGGGVVICSQN